MTSSSETGESSLQGPQFPDEPIAAAMRKWGEELCREDVSVMEVCLRLGLVASAGESALNRAHRRSGLRPGDFDVLATLYRAPEPYAAHSLRSMLLLSKAGMSARLGRLLDAGLVSITTSDSDARVKLVTLTAEGAATLSRTLPIHIETERALLDPLDQDEQRTLLDLLRKLSRNQ